MTSPQHRPPHLRLVQTGAQPASRVARRVGEGVLDAMPAGLEVTESINGVVSVRRADPARPRAPLGDMEIVREEVGRHPHLQRYVVDGRDGEIIINEPVGGLGEEQVRVLATVMGIASPRLREATIPRRPQYKPVMKFAPEPLSPGDYAVFRMTYRGHGGWHILTGGPLAALAKRYVGHIGKESFFELL